ncbi:thymidine phosphorylase family protein [Exilibacterium tricleocarpae]|uniref:Putative thymidine phosphorylase n=1 Tax=Exilibacterium tricleocarpae TaxID=2591008 RepID=A0A545TVB3_9GAMM|nr:thymidine phosphorylase family protein [Exilibacterium tricleocarpae]TQV81153.1 thymidine phosphorylase family protein [Exilibacterium tricleocarpae]
MLENGSRGLTATRMGIDTQQELVVYMRSDCQVCRSEGFVAQTRVRLRLEERYIIAKLNLVSAALLAPGSIGLSDSAWHKLGAAEGDRLRVEHPHYLTSLSFVRSKIFNNRLSAQAIRHIIGDIAAGRYSDVHLAAFLTACSGDRLDLPEIIDLTKAMVSVGKVLSWPGRSTVLDKHCVGGLPGNRTTPIVAAIVAAAGLTIPKTSSRSITSPAGTADTMEVLTGVELSLEQLQAVVGAEGACLAWGGSINISPADDLLIRVERAINLDGEGQLIASVLSKKIAAGATHVIIDIPVGESAKVRSQKRARHLSTLFAAVGNELGIRVLPVITDGRQPVGFGIGPALEAADVMAVLQRSPQAPVDLRRRALFLAGLLLELSDQYAPGEGRAVAESLLDSGSAWEKFRAVCRRQGGLKSIPTAPYQRRICARTGGRVKSFDNRQLAQIAKLAGAPKAKAAGIQLAKKLGDTVTAGELLMTIHAETQGELRYAENFYHRVENVCRIE